MVKVIAVVNQKGRVAKTTSTVHLGVAIAETGKKVLLVDLDSQGHIAEAFNIVADELEYDMSDVFEGKKQIVDIIMPDVRANLNVTPSDVQLADMDVGEYEHPRGTIKESVRASVNPRRLQGTYS
jgi:chromosome partitioning protein